MYLDWYMEAALATCWHSLVEYYYSCVIFWHKKCNRKIQKQLVISFMEQHHTCTDTTISHWRFITLCHKSNIFLLTNTMYVCNNHERLFPCNENQKYILIEATDMCQALCLRRIHLVPSYPLALYIGYISYRSRLHRVWLWQLHNIWHR